MPRWGMFRRRRWSFGRSVGSREGHRGGAQPEVPVGGRVIFNQSS